MVENNKCLAQRIWLVPLTFMTSFAQKKKTNQNTNVNWLMDNQNVLHINANTVSCLSMQKVCATARLDRPTAIEGIPPGVPLHSILSPNLL